MKKILIIDDDKNNCELLAGYLEKNGYQTAYSLFGKTGIERVTSENFDIVLSRFRLPDSDGLEILKKIKEIKPTLPVIIMTAYAEVRMAVKMIKSGAFDYVTMPIHQEEILRSIERATAKKKKKENSSTFGKEFITGQSKVIHKVLNHVNVVAPTEITVLIEGETGSGKEYIARAIHYKSKRKKKPFIAVDCGAIPKELANSELFGHVKGAFTGAVKEKKGFFEEAKGGTLFLDEIGNLPHANQVKLLRALQERVINRVGDNRDIKVDVRLIVATNDDLMEQMENNEFREDLYHRINGFKISLPALRQRGEDILEFTDYFISKANDSFQRNVTALDDEVKELFLNYEWHGNIRELQNVVNRAVLLTKGQTINADVLPPEIIGSMKKQTVNATINEFDTYDLKEVTEITEKQVIQDALEKAKFNKSKAAQMLNIDRKTLYKKIIQYEIEMLK
jgi:two-component system response regulator HydG